MKTKIELEQAAKDLQREAVDILLRDTNLSFNSAKRLVDCIAGNSLLEVAIVQAEVRTKPSKHELALQKIASCPCDTPFHCKDNPTQKCVTCIAREALWN